MRACSGGDSGRRAEFRGWHPAVGKLIGIEMGWESVWYGFLWISKIKMQKYIAKIKEAKLEVGRVLSVNAFL
jgi:hypothetical protein